MNLKIFIDTNIYLNSILDRDDGISKEVFSFLVGAEVELFLNDISIINIHYIIKKYFDRNIVINELKIIQKENRLVSVDKYIIDRALNSDFKDFEDAIQFYCAKNIFADLIITDNIKDYQLSDIEVMSAKDFHEKYILKK